ncbi:terminase [Morganella phage Mecenats66]|nr:terminase [Morganella phage Mecenats66]
MSNRLKIHLPPLFQRQEFIKQNQQSVNIIPAGEKSGKTTLGIEIMLTNAKGVINSKAPGCWVCETTNDIDDVISRFVDALGGLLKRRLGNGVIELYNNNRIYFFGMDQDPDLYNKYGVVIIDDCSSNRQLMQFYQTVIRPAIKFYDGSAFFFGMPNGKTSDFYEMYRLCERLPRWFSCPMPSFDNPYFPDDELDSVDSCSPDELKQRYLAEFTEHSLEMSLSSKIIRPNETFFEWCLRLQKEGLKVDGHPFDLSKRESLHEIYRQIPTTIEEAYQRILVLQKGAQMGLTVFEQLADIYMAIKFAPCNVLMYLPNRSLASYKSSNRFLPIVYTMKDVKKLFGSDGKKGGDGNVMSRKMPNLGSNFLFLWTSGKSGGTTESFPGDILSLDETQGMTLEQIDRVRERLSASRIKMLLMLSTPLYPEMDINAWYRDGDQRKFHTDCGCEGGVILTDVFMDAALNKTGKIPVVFNSGQFPDGPEDFVYYCPECGEYIPEPQKGRWEAKNPESKIISYHMSQILSPTVSPRELWEAYHRADTADRRQNFFCRKLGSPYSDPSQVPVNMAMLQRCVENGIAEGLTWQRTGHNCFAGADQMGSFICLMVAKRMPSGRMGIVHVEAIYALDPWAVLDQRMVEFGIDVMVVEQLPNVDSARQFAKRHEGKVFLIVDYSNLKEDLVIWMDTAESDQDYKTADEFRVKYTIRADQFKCMDWAFSRLADSYVLFPDPDKLISEVREGGEKKQAFILREMVFYHFTKTGLVVMQDDEERKTRRKVLKIGIDPHFSYAFMALCMAWFRAYGTSKIFIPGMQDTTKQVAGLAEGSNIPVAVAEITQMFDEINNVCGDCIHYDRESGMCKEMEARVDIKEIGCYGYERKK